jgi:hypothetical protein
MKLGSGMAPVVAAREAGIVVGLGTDGAAGSNNDLDMLDAMDFAGKLAKVSALDPTPLTAPELLRMATIDGARALGLDRLVGSLEPGKMGPDRRRAGKHPRAARVRPSFHRRLRLAGGRRLAHHRRRKGPLGRPARPRPGRGESARRGEGVREGPNRSKR